MKSILLTIIKELRLTELNLNIAEHLLQKRGLSNQPICIITAIQRLGHTIARTLNYGKPSSLDLLRFGECLESKSFVMLDDSNSYNELFKVRTVQRKC